MAIVVAIIGGGVAMLIFKDEIVEWIINKDYKCPECGQLKWKADVGSEVDVVVSKGGQIEEGSNDDGWISKLRDWAAENDVTELPSENGQLKNLTSLDLSYSKLTELPAEIGQLQKLRTLNLFYTYRLTKLPPAIGQLKNLKIHLTDSDSNAME
jgi:hypothetical protein